MTGEKSPYSWLGDAVSASCPLSRRRLIGGTLAALAIPTALTAAPAFAVDVDSSETPQLAAWGEQLKAQVASWWPLITEELASPGFTPPEQVRLVLTKSRPGGWGGPTQPTVIYLGAAVSEARPHQINYIAFELVHVVQSYHGVIKRWLFDGIADYVRYYILFPQDPERFFTPTGADFRKKSTMGAALLDWVERERGVGAVRQLNAAIRQGQDGETVLQQLAGIPLEEAWSRVMTSLTEGSPAPVAKPA